MFQKKDIIYSGNIGVCVVTEIAKLTDKRGETVNYYGLKALRDGKTAYVPVENHSVELRELLSINDAIEIKNAKYDDCSANEKYEIDYVLQTVKGDK